MPKPSRSMFASLPFELRSNLRSQVLLPLGDKAQEARSKAEHVLDAAVGGMLSTQPASEVDESDDDDVDVDADAQAGSQSALGPSQPIRSSAVAGPSRLRQTPAVKSVRYEASWVHEKAQASTGEDKPHPAKKRRGNKAKKAVITNQYAGHPWDCTGLVPRYSDYEQVPHDLKKYYAQRRLYFPEYDSVPLLLDRTGWFSITPQPIAAHIAERTACDLAIDAFCGVGGNTIEFAKTCERVIAMDNDISRLKLARHNALQLGVADRIEFILGDFTEFARAYAARTRVGDKDAIDVVFLSPPWGGIDYLEGADLFPLSAILPIPGDDLFKLTSTLTPNIAYYLPRNTDLAQLSALAPRLAVTGVAQAEGRGRTREWVEVEEEWVGDKMKAITAYFGGLVADE
ncbi:hypothetical protein IAU60_005155 [Kwoniella sp. DSM 27419]